ncbi:MAG: HlyD family secretion protein [Faecousia sp.]
MKKTHPIRRLFLFLLLAALVAGLAAMPMLTASRADEEDKASILTSSVQRREVSKFLCYGAPLETEQAKQVTVPYGVNVTEFLAANGDSVLAGDPIAQVDSVSVMTAVRQVQESLESIASDLKEVRTKITPGVITVNEDGAICVDGKQIDDSKLSDYFQFVTLSEQHREYEQLMLDLFLLCQDGTVTAPCDGLVSDVDKTQIVKLSASGEPRLVFLATNTPTGEDDETEYYCYVGKVEMVVDGLWLLRRGASVTVTDFLDLGGVDLTMTEEVNIFDPSGMGIFRHNGEQWNTSSVQPGDIVLIVGNAPWILVIGSAEVDVPEEPTEPTDPVRPTAPESTEPEQETPGQKPSSGGSFGGSAGSTMPSGSDRGNASSAAGVGSSLYSTEKIQLATVTPMETMSITLSVDEMDIAELSLGMNAEVTFEALPSQVFSAEITEISQFGVTGDGSSKFAVKLELPCSEGMLPGMNAKVKIPLETRPDCLTVPVAALTEQGNETLVYTGFDEKTQTLTNPVPVQTGLSDGEYVQILSGLTENQPIWYSYYDKLEISNAVEKKGF